MQLGIDQVLAWLHHRFLSFDGIIHGCLLSKISDILWIGDAEQRGLLDLNLPFVVVELIIHPLSDLSSVKENQFPCES